MAAFSGYCESCGRRATDGVFSLLNRGLICISCSVVESEIVALNSISEALEAPTETRPRMAAVH